MASGFTPLDAKGGIAVPPDVTQVKAAFSPNSDVWSPNEQVTKTEIIRVEQFPKWFIALSILFVVTKIMKGKIK